MKGNSARRALLLTGGVMAGVGIGWLTAPRPGRWLRNQAWQKLARWRHRGRRRLHKRRKDAVNRWHGGVAMAREYLNRRRQTESDTVDARTLVDRVHSQIGHRLAPALEHANLSAVDDVVYVHGFVESAALRNDLVHAIAAIDGVGAVRAEAVRIGRSPGVRAAGFPPMGARRQVF